MTAFAEAEARLRRRLQFGKPAREEAVRLALTCATPEEAARFVKLLTEYRPALAPRAPEDPAGALSSELIEQIATGWPETEEQAGALGRVMLAWYFSLFRH
jgi:hypothetical protein